MKKKKSSVYKGSPTPPPKQSGMGKRLREYRKALRKFGGRKH